MPTETIIASVFGALGMALLGLMTKVAVTYPKAYPKLFPWTLGLGLEMIFGFFLWNAAIWQSQSAALTSPHAKGIDVFGVSTDIGSYTVPLIWSIAPLILIVYGNVLLHLPSWLIEEKPQS